jgi:hypothetical protein
MIALVITSAVALSGSGVAIRAAGFAIVPIIVWGVVFGLAALFGSMRGLFQADPVTTLSGAVITIVGGAIVVFAIQRAELGFILSSLI